jgi:hypothetical protein
MSSNWTAEETKRGIRSINARVGGCRVSVHRFAINAPPDQWHLTVRGWLDIDARPLNSLDLESAKQEALAHLSALCKKILKAIPKL